MEDYLLCLLLYCVDVEIYVVWAVQFALVEDAYVLMSQCFCIFYEGSFLQCPEITILICYSVGSM